MNLYEVIIELSKVHAPMQKGGFTDGLRFDLVHKSIGTKGTMIMEEGRVIPQTICGIEITEDMELIDEYDNPYEVLEEKYRRYKTSVPNPYSKYLKNNFLAKEFNELSHKEFMDGCPRQIARAELEAFVLLTHFEWQNDKHHYWQSPNDRNLIIKREWSD